MAASIPAALSIGSSLAGIGGSLFGKSTAENANLPQMWQMPNMTEAANAAYSQIGQLPATNLGNQVLPQYQDITQQLANSPYAPGFQQGAGVASQMGQQAAQGATQAGQYMQGVGQSLVPYAQQIGQTAFDPQNALYARTLQQLQEQMRAGQSARGIGTTPYGAGLENQGLSNFNIDWQNQQLQRQTSGGQAMGAMAGQAGNLIGGGQQMINAAPGQYLTASSYPYATQQAIGQAGTSALSNLLGAGQQAQNLAQTPIQDYLSYIGAGNQAGGVANQLGQVGLNQANLGFNQNQTLGSGLGAGLAGLSKQSNWNWLGSM
jgi:hypothetical protein